MTSGDTQPTSRPELNTELQALLIRAYENGIDVKGGFECRNGTGHPDWDVIVTKVEKPDASD